MSTHPSTRPSSLRQGERQLFKEKEEGEMTAKFVIAAILGAAMHLHRQVTVETVETVVTGVAGVTGMTGAFPLADGRHGKPHASLAPP